MIGAKKTKLRSINRFYAICIFDPKVEGESDFYFLAKKGDSIVKPAFADYLLLKKGNKTYYGYFRQIWVQ
jgi:hypothetical protein